LLKLNSIDGKINVYAFMLDVDSYTKDFKIVSPKGIISEKERL